MGYATVIDVETYAPARAPFSGRTVPAATTVAAMLIDVSRDIDHELVQAGYAIPLDAGASTALEFLRVACAKCAAAVVEETAPTATKESREAARAMCDRAMKMVRDGELPGVDRDEQQSMPRSGFSATSYFQRDMRL